MHMILSFNYESFPDIMANFVIHNITSINNSTSDVIFPFPFDNNIYLAI